MNTKPDIAILSFSNIQRDGRVLRQIEYLSRHYRVSVLGYGKLPPTLSDQVPMYSIQPPTSRARRLRKALWLPLAKFTTAHFYETWYWGEEEFKAAYAILCQLRPTAIHANDWEALPVAVRASQETGALVVADLHEYAPLMRENRPYWKLFYKPLIEYYLNRTLSCVAASVTVSRAIADRYASEYAIQPIVVMNAPKTSPSLTFKPTQSDVISLVHHGNASRDRQLERMIETVAYLDQRYHLHLMLVSRDTRYLAALQALAVRRASGRVHFVSPVPPDEIVARIARFDIGFYPIPNTTYNHLAALPNKFFDFVTAGLAVCIGPSLEMSHLIHEYGFGVVAPALTPSIIAETLNHLTTDAIDAMKHAAFQAARRLNADIEMQKLINLYQKLMVKRKT